MHPRTESQSTFTTHDGEALSYRAWTPMTRTARGAVVLLHRGHEHSGRMAHLVHELNLPDYAFFAWDARGHGASPGPRGFSPGAATSVRDVQDFIDHIEEEHGFAAEDIAVVGQSVGAVLAAAWAHDYAPKLRAMVLAAPAFSIKLYVPFARPGLAALKRLRGDFYVKSYVTPRQLTHDAERIASYEDDPLIARAISVNMLLGLHALSERIVRDAQAITVPTQVLISGSDRVVHAGPQHAFFERLGTAHKECHVLDGFFHDTLGEKHRAAAIDTVRAFLVARFEAPVAQPDLLDAHKQGFTFREKEELEAPLSPLSPRDLYWSATRAGLRLAAKLSRGIAVGARTGFDSGSMLDYVYENVPRGVTALGRAIDRAYLDAVGWKGIRQRKVHLEELLARAAERTREAGLPVRILDVAAGHGRYVLDAIETADVQPDRVLLRDFSAINVTAGRRLVAEKGLSRIAAFEQGDAFDPDSIAAVDPEPTVGVVSGLYELFPDNDAVRASLSGLARAIPEGGCLVYTGQPWHPQLEFIARALTSHRDGKPWVMRRRTQAEMDQLVEQAGFRKVEQRIDQWGIFTVSIAVRETR